ncbi:hypothetical protein [Micropruina sp.]|uniref:variant leucine-rich repeat-containing protein n=1 Tax=Micropruina sp. TaxID=2737536 RepID=UPI0026059A71|nr:hypothetical protein [Micropruina sp.]
MTGRDYANLETARAALADPRLPAPELLALCFAQPSLRAEAAMHPSADRNLLGWLAAQDDPVVAATAGVRLNSLGAAPPPIQAPPAAAPFQSAFAAQQVPGQPILPPSAQPAFAAAQQAPAQPAPAQTSVRSGKGRRLALIGGAAAAALAAAAATWFWVIPIFLGGGSAAAVSYAPEFRQAPGLTAVSAIEGLPSSQEWTTSFVEAGPDLMVGWNSTPAVYDYQFEAKEYRSAVEARQQWDADYAVGFADGARCLKRTDADLTWYSSIAEYCEYQTSENLSTTSSGGYAGYGDAVRGLSADPSRDSSAPEVPAKPVPPAIGDNLVGVDLKSAKVAWTWNPADLWEGVTPSIYGFRVSDGVIAVLLADPAENSDEDANPVYWLATLDAKSGAVKSSVQTSRRDAWSIQWLVGDSLIVTNDKQQLRALNVADLSQEKWNSSAVPMYAEEGGYAEVLPGGYLLTDNGYLRASDGQRAEFAIDAGRRGVLLAKLPGTEDQLIRTESDSERETQRIAGFDAGKNSETWVLDRLSLGAHVRVAGGLLLVMDAGELSAYTIKGDELESRWRHRCAASSCWLTFADNDRVVVSEESEVYVLSLREQGKLIGSVRVQPYSYSFVAKSVLYTVEDNGDGHEMIAYDLDKSGFPALWRSAVFAGWVSQPGEHLVIEDSGRAQLGILGGDRDDWRALEPRESP